MAANKTDIIVYAHWPEAKVEQITGNHHTFFSKRFDRAGDERIHFASAMTMTGHFETEIRDQTPSYLELNTLGF
jgi:serine/threonine-protein kinase HipA